MVTFLIGYGKEFEFVMGKQWKTLNGGAVLFLLLKKIFSLHTY